MNIKDTGSLFKKVIEHMLGKYKPKKNNNNVANLVANIKNQEEKERL